MSWTAATDDHTPAGALSYNLRIGSSPGANNLMASMANSSTGFRRVAALGNAQRRLTWTLTIPSDPVYWSVQAIDGSSLGPSFGPEGLVQSQSGLSVEPVLPAACSLGPATPDPVTERTSITFALPARVPVELDVFDVSGRHVATLAHERFDAGYHSVHWKGRDGAGRVIPAGVYMVRLQAGPESRTQKLVVRR